MHIDVAGLAAVNDARNDIAVLVLDIDQDRRADQGDRFYLIEEGEVEVFEDGVFRRNEGPGDGFGEIALLRDVPRTATVRTIAPTTLLALDRDQFITAVTGHRRSHQVAHTGRRRPLGRRPRLTQAAIPFPPLPPCRAFPGGSGRSR